jgi:hypothetical protein
MKKTAGICKVIKYAVVMGLGMMLYEDAPLWASASTWSNSVVSERESSGKFDYSVSLGGRSYPFGGAVFGHAGYSLPLWGEKKPGKYDYGFIYSSLNLSTNLLVNRAEGSFEVYPISFIGLGSGVSVTSRNTGNYPGVDCGAQECNGALFRSWHRAKVYFGYRNFVGSASATYQNLGLLSSSRAFLDEIMAIRGNAGGDQLFNGEISLAYRWSSRLVSGVHYQAAKMIHSGMRNVLADCFGSYLDDQWSWTLGAGVYESTLQALSPTTYFLVNWTNVQWLGI